jgi:uncharacterized protein (DUF433 family)
MGEHIVVATGVCGGRPTFKYTRLEVSVVLDLLASGWTIDDVIREYAESHLTATAIQEALHLAKDALIRVACETQPAL